jgi:hypothetical protein
MYSDVVKFVEDAGEKHGGAPVTALEDGVEQVLAVGVGAALVDVEHFGPVEGVVEVDQNFEVVEFMLDMSFDLRECECTKKESPASEMKYLLKVT